jgi:hypothetical protein
MEYKEEKKSSLSTRDTFSPIELMEDLVYNSPTLRRPPPPPPSEPPLMVAGGDIFETSNQYSIAYSTDKGLTWNGSEDSKSIFLTTKSIAWNGTKWIAVGFAAIGTTYSIAYSTNGINWTGIENSNQIISTGSDIIWDGSRWIIVGQSTNSNTLAYSIDGINWIYPTNSPHNERSLSIETDGKIWVVGGQKIDGNDIVYTNNIIDGTWSFATNTFTSNCNDIKYNGTRWVAVGDDTDSEEFSSIKYSDDGKTWQNCTNTFVGLNGGRGIGWNGTRWIAVGMGNNPVEHIKYSTDAISWQNSSSNPLENETYGVAWNGTRWVAVGDGSKTICYSNDNGQTWIAVSNSDSLFYIGNSVL